MFLRLSGIDVPEYAFRELWQDKKEGIALGDSLDIINPLQHIPIVSLIYRMTTEDDIGIGLRLLGCALFGGPLASSSPACRHYLKIIPPVRLNNLPRLHGTR